MSGKGIRFCEYSTIDLQIILGDAAPTGCATSVLLTVNMTQFTIIVTC